MNTAMEMFVLMMFACTIGFIIASIKFITTNIKRKIRYEQFLKSRKWKQFRDSHITISSTLSARGSSQKNIQKSFKRILTLDFAFIIAGYIIIALFSRHDLFEGTIVYIILSIIAYSIATFVSSKLYVDVFKKFAILFYVATLALSLYIFDLGDFYFPLMKLITCGTCIYSAVKFKTEWARWIFGGLAVLYNPVFQIRLADSKHDLEKAYFSINIIMILFMWVALYIENKNRSQNVL